MDNFLDPDAKNTKKRKRIQKQLKQDEETLFQPDDEDLNRVENKDEISLNLQNVETPANRRLRLAKKYLRKVKEDIDSEDEDPDRDLIAERLKYDVMEAEGKIFHQISQKFLTIIPETLKVRTFKSNKNCHTQPITTVSIAIPNERVISLATPTIISIHPRPIYIFSTSKDGSIVKWDFYTAKKLHFFGGGKKATKKIKKRLSENKLKHQGHTDHILASCCSSDGQYLVTGGRDKILQIWSTLTNLPLSTFRHHRDAITALCFRQGQNQLYTGSLDRSIKVFNIDEKSYIETLFGHQDMVTSLATLQRERCVSAGARDKTCRLWKIVEESQLIFRCVGSVVEAEEYSGKEVSKKLKKVIGGMGGSSDAVAMVDEDTFLSGTDSGAISIWSVNKKKPIYTRLFCHGNGSLTQPNEDGNEALVEGAYCHWITALGTIPYSDVFASGSCDGEVRIWKISAEKKSFNAMFSIPMIGFINSLSFFKGPSLNRNESVGKEDEGVEFDGLYLAAAVSAEHRLGRWWKLKNLKNAVNVITIF